MKIIPLSKKNISEAIDLILRVFPESRVQDEDFAPRWFKASLSPKENKKLYSSFGVKYLKYWVVIDKDTKKIIGITGVYSLEKDEEEAFWLAWTCVHPNFRGMGVGKMLMEYIIRKAKDKKRKYLRLYTSTNPNEAVAQKMYDKMGFKIIKRENKGKYERIYKELKLNALSGVSIF